MRVFASISITLFYCLFASAGTSASTSLVKLEKTEAASCFKIFSNGLKKISKDDDPVLDHGKLKKDDKAEFISYRPIFFSPIISLHHPRTLRIKSSLSPPA